MEGGYIAGPVAFGSLLAGLERRGCGGCGSGRCGAANPEGVAKSLVGLPGLALRNLAKTERFLLETEGSEETQILALHHKTFYGEGHPGHLPPLNDAPTALDIRPIAFYLPQFHREPKNDEWWGTGHTEWRPVTRGYPRFFGHEQPRLPADLGFYDLLNPETLAAQGKLVRAYGLAGLFVFRYFFGDGEEALSRPMDVLLANPEIDFPFCCLWANHDWKRTWDGTGEILQRQHHGDGIEERYLQSIMPALKDPRYLRVGDRPIVGILIPSMIPDLPSAIEEWRKTCREAGLGNPYIIGFKLRPEEKLDALGLDAISHYAPHGYLANAGVRPKGLNDTTVFSYLEAREYTLSEFARSQELSIPSTACGWDNSTRYNGNGRIVHGATPERFRVWVDVLREELSSKPHEERLLFVKGWNEWSEGAHLEPDLHWGHAYLRALNAGSLSGLVAKAPGLD